MNTSTLEAERDSTASLQATVKPSNATNKSVSWFSSDKNIASVDGEGNIWCVNEGTATITVRTDYGAFEARCKVTVKPAHSPARLWAGWLDDQTVVEGDMVTFTVNPTGGTGTYSYQWYRASSSTATGSKVSTQKSYSFTASKTYNGYYYYCVVTAGTESSTSGRARLTVEEKVTVGNPVLTDRSTGLEFERNKTVEYSTARGDLLLNVSATGGCGKFKVVAIYLDDEPDFSSTGSNQATSSNKLYDGDFQLTSGWYSDNDGIPFGVADMAKGKYVKIAVGAYAKSTDAEPKTWTNIGLRIVEEDVLHNAEPSAWLKGRFDYLKTMLPHGKYWCPSSGYRSITLENGSGGAYYNTYISDNRKRSINRTSRCS